MKRSILISIHPQHVERILDGSKTFEYRRLIPKDPISHIVIYATAPIKQVVAVASVDRILEGKPSEIWKKTKSKGGIKECFFESYFKDRSKAYALSIGDLKTLSSPVDLADICSNLKPPQSFLYLEGERLQRVLDRVSCKTSKIVA